jgi:uncharacterized RDD family membrane protein YckC
MRVRRERTGRETRALSTSAIQPHSDQNWKQEVNQRLAAHKSRREGGATLRAFPSPAQFSGSIRAAQAAARVAARYAHAPSYYSQMLAEEARSESGMTEAAAQASRQIDVAPETMLAELEAAPAVAHLPAVAPESASRQVISSAQSTFFDPFLEIERPVFSTEREPSSELEVRWEPDLPVRPAGGSHPRALRRPEPQIALTMEDWRGTVHGEPETVEPALPIHANLIEFPRELIAARKVRPRIAEGPLVPNGEPQGQLSIFEVDAASISVQPEPAETPVEPGVTGWSRMRLDADPVSETAAQPATPTRAHAIQHAPFSLRLMAAMVDGSLVGAVFCASALAAASLSFRPTMRVMELIAAGTLLAIGVLYHAIFLRFAGTTPGMRYAGISLCTFDDQKPTPWQMRRRVGAVLVSLLPVGLGVLWAIFDEDHLSWHDRISRTYQRCA